MYISDVIRRSGRNLGSAKIRTALTALAIAVGTFVLVMTLAASNGVRQFVDRVIADNFDPAELIVAKDESLFGAADTSKPREYDPSFGEIINNAGAATQIKRLTQADIEAIRAIEGVEQVREAVNVSFEYITRPDQKRYIGTAQALNPAQNPDLLAGTIPRPLGNGQLLLPEGYLEPLGFASAEAAIGQTLTTVVRRSLTEAEARQLLQGVDPAELQRASEQVFVETIFTIAGVMKQPLTAQPGTELYMYISAEDALQLNDLVTAGTENYRMYAFAFARVKNGDDPAVLERVQNAIKEKGYQAQSVKDTQEFLTQIVNVLQGIVAAFAAIAILASVFGVVNTMYISVLQRTREVGLMKALGMRRRDISRLFRFEAAWIGFLGGLLGSLLAVVAGTLLNPWISRQLELGPDNYLLIFRLPEVVAVIIILMMVATIAGLLPARKAAKLDPIEALRAE